MDREMRRLAKRATEAMRVVTSAIRGMHGIEVADGFFNVYNEVTSQSKTVLYHPESGYIFKQHLVPPVSSLTGQVLGTVKFDGVTYPVRIPNFWVMETDDGRYLSIEEYITGESCDCGTGGWCEHARKVAKATNCSDAHTGNWKIMGNEIVLFDFESLDN